MGPALRTSRHPAQAGQASFTSPYIWIGSCAGSASHRAQTAEALPQFASPGAWYPPCKTPGNRISITLPEKLGLQCRIVLVDLPIRLREVYSASKMLRIINL
jgi:hypothetical protein